ncbi:PIN domain-containing protein, partial [Candidatus Gottesmanbacteria bacterium]|nr:PIN domain-containing protein [Candidatus Gottesmanbacteria bacterium]
KRASLMKKHLWRVFFNASVILAGLFSPKGGSAKILSWVKKRRIEGIISEIVFQETIRNAEKIGWKKKDLEKELIMLFPRILAAPAKEKVEIWRKIVVDSGDAHLLASATKDGCLFLVSLDKKHVLNLKGEIKQLKIVSPAELIEISHR